MEIYCCRCGCVTTHREVEEEDEVFEFAVECLVCNTIWEAETPYEVD